MGLRERRIVESGYDAIASQYLDARVEGEDVALLSELVEHLRPGDRVLDAGCGAGVPVMALLVDAGLDLAGLDLSKVQLETARSHLGDASLVQGDLAALPFGDGSFTALVSYYAIVHVPRSQHLTVFGEVRRVLVPDGWALLCLGANDLPADHDPTSWLGAPMFWSHFDARTNLRLLGEVGLAVVRHHLVADPMGHGEHLFALVSRRR